MVIFAFSTRKDQHHRLNKLQSYSLPSSSYTNLTLGTSGTTYTAPADGWFYISKKSSASDQSISFNYLNGNNEVYASWNMISTNTSQILSFLRPVSKGQKVQINYASTGVTNDFKFIYALGSEPQT